MTDNKQTMYITSIGCPNCGDWRTIDGYFSFRNKRLHNKTAREAKVDVTTFLGDFFSQKPLCTKCHTAYDATRDDLVRFLSGNPKVKLTGARRRR